MSESSKATEAALVVGPSDGNGEECSMTPSQAPRRHEKYYIEDRLSIFSVEDCLFKVHRYYLILESPVFKDMFMCPPEAGMLEGESDLRPIVLPDTTRKEFEALLDFLYNRMYNRYPSFSLSKWMDLLTIADRFQFENVRERAIDELTTSEKSMDAVDELLVSVKCRVPQWTIPALSKLVTQPNILETEAAARLPLDILMRVWKTREEYLATYPRGTQAVNTPISNFSSFGSHLAPPAPAKDSAVSAIATDEQPDPIPPLTDASVENKHDMYWFSGPPMATLKVPSGTNLYRVHRYLLERESEYCRTLFSANPAQDPSFIYDLVGCKDSEVEALLGFLYDPPEKMPEQALSKVIDLLTISTRLSLNQTRECALAMLAQRREKMGAVEQIVIAQKHGITSWLEPAYSSIIARAEPLREHEAERLPLSTIVMLTSAREDNLRRTLLLEFEGEDEGETPGSGFGG
ncbi:hypothetical protein EVG20_g9486, partial [Dentipellis fragilis]